MNQKLPGSIILFSALLAVTVAPGGKLAVLSWFDAPGRFHWNGRSD